jgi:hypothetical protein
MPSGRSRRRAWRRPVQRLLPHPSHKPDDRPERAIGLVETSIAIAVSPNATSTNRIGRGANFRSRFVTPALMPELALHNETTRLTRKLIPSVVLPCAAPRRDVRWRFRETASPIVELGTITFPGTRVGGMPRKPSRDQQSAQSDRQQRLTPALRQRRSSSRGRITDGHSLPLQSATEDCASRVVRAAPGTTTHGSCARRTARRTAGNTLSASSLPGLLLPDSLLLCLLKDTGDRGKKKWGQGA